MDAQIAYNARNRSLVITAIMVALLFVILFFVTLSYYDPPINNAIAINFGDDTQGMEVEEPSPARSKSQSMAETAASKATSKEMKFEAEKVLTQEESSPVTTVVGKTIKPLEKAKAPAKNVSKESNVTPSTTNKKEEAKGSATDSRFGAIGGQGTSGTGEGDGSKMGNKGILSEDPTAGDNEHSFAKGNRKLLYKPSPPNFDICPNNEYGNLVVGFKVDTKGKVIANTLYFNAKGNQVTANNCIKEIVRQYILKLRYTPGTIPAESTQQTINIKPIN